MSGRERIRRRHAAARAAVLPVLLLLSALPALAGWKEVPVDVAVAARLKLDPSDKILVALFRANPHPRLDMGLEISQWVRREIARQTPFTVLDVPPPPIPEQRPEKLAVNDVFWRRMGEDFRADVIIAGVAEYRIEDRSGYVTRDVESPITGQTVRQTVYAERKGFHLKIEIFFLKGDNGALLLTDTWTEDRTLDSGSGQGEDLQELYDMLDQMRPRLRGALLPTMLQQPRFIWVN